MKKLFWEDAYLTEFDAAVTDRRIRNGKTHVLLDQTAFYPESGGQPSDTGTIDGIAVEHVYEDQGLVWHVMAAAPATERVHGAVDWDRRFHWMQQHLGQHILSAVCVAYFHSNTVNLRFTEEGLHIDVDRPLSRADLEKAEQLANSFIYKNIPVETGFPPMDEIRRFSKRKLPETADAVRIVKIGDLDYIPCCGTHAASTGEVGLVKILSSEAVKGAFRIHFICGKAALQRLCRVWDAHMGIDRLLGIESGAELERVTKLKNDFDELKKAQSTLHEKLAHYEAERLVRTAEPCGDKKVIACVLRGFERETVQRLFAQLQERKGLLILLGAETSDGAVLMFGCHKSEKGFDVRAALKEGMALIEGRGGGGPSFAQGLGANANGLSAAVQKAKEMLTGA